MTRYAASTSVTVQKSRAQIEKLLQRWGCDGLRWTNLYGAGTVTIEFTWEHEERGYLARFTIKVPNDDQLRSEACHGSTGRYLQTKFDNLTEHRGRQEHRALGLLLKAAFVAIEEGILDAETFFLPYLVGSDGRTVAEVALPRLGLLLGEGGASALLALSSGDS